MSSVSARTAAGAVAALERLDQRPVVVHREPVTLLLVDACGGADVRPGLEPEALDDRDQHRRTRRLVDAEVEGVVELGGRLRLV